MVDEVLIKFKLYFSRDQMKELANYMAIKLGFVHDKRWKKMKPSNPFDLAFLFK